MKTILVLSIASILALVNGEDDIFSACTEGNIDKVQQFLKADPSLISAVDKFDNSPLMMAIFAKKPQLVAELLKLKPSHDHKNKIGNTAMHLARIFHSKKVVPLRDASASLW